MNVILANIDRTNWREAIDLKVRPDQERFVATPIFSLAAALVRRWGDEYVYAPRLISVGSLQVGYVCTVCNPETIDEYWIDDILIDARYQGRGYGRIAVAEVIRQILRDYPCCGTVKLSCHEENVHAARIYLTLGFGRTGGMNPESGHPNYELTGEALRAFR